MSFVPAQKYEPPADVYAEHRCPDCKHLKYADDQPGDPCRWVHAGLCRCTVHLTPAQRIEAAAAEGGGES